MKNHLWQLAILVIALAACQNSKKETTQTDTLHQDTLPVAVGPNKLMEEFAPIIHGVWAKMDYLNEVVKYKSPYKARRLAEGIVEMHIDTNEINADSLDVGVSWNNHEGDTRTIFFRPTKRPHTLKLDQDELTYSISGKDTLLFLRQLSDKSQSKIVYKKLSNDVKSDLGAGIESYISKKLIAGRYQITDSTGAKRTVTFGEYGNVYGLDKFLSYTLQNDFIVEMENNMDAVIFNLSEKTQTDYNFEIKGDTLSIYSFKPTTDSLYLQRAELKYKLVRIPN